MEINKEGEVNIAVMLNRIDAYSSKEVEEALATVVNEDGVKLLCDFSQTEYISSAGLRVLLGTAKKLQKAGGQIALFALTPYVKEVFEISGFTQIFKIHDTQEEALAAIG